MKDKPTMTQTLEKTAREDSALMVAASPPTVVEQMLHAVIEKGVTSENVGALDKLVGLYERMEEKRAEQRFAEAFVALQSEMPKVKAVKAIPNRDGTVRSTFAPYEEIMREVAPLLQRHNFTITFSTDFKEGRIIKTCTLQHVGGHQRSNSFAVRIGSGPPGCSEAQADGAAGTYAKRGALCDCLNIVIDHDTDARAEGGTITEEQADELERRVKMTNSNVAAFLKFAGNVKSFAEIPTTAYDRCDEMLRRKEQQP